ncbi:MAG: MBL fold metallo-hydrolase [Acidobacteria bacterium]|nr:MBL fold metallo-hydrolase [Acidobacteriota bacterium]
MSLNRRQFLTSSSLALAASTLNVRRLFAQATQAAPQTAFTALRGTVGFFTGQGGTIGYHISKDGVVVIDAQMPATAKICLDGIKERSGGRIIDYLVNTHHHGDHTGGNPVFRPAVKKILAHVNEPRLQREAAARAAAARPDAPAPEIVVADTTYTTTWRETVGADTMALKYYGPAHTSGDSVVTFEKANVVHMGDLVFNRSHPYIDKPAGASIASWTKILDVVAADHAADTIYIFGHANPKFQVTGSKADLAYMRDYLGALLEFVRGEIKAGRTRDAILGISDPLKGFPDHGPLIPRVLTAAYEELAQ